MKDQLTNFLDDSWQERKLENREKRLEIFRMVAWINVLVIIDAFALGQVEVTLTKVLWFALALVIAAGSSFSAEEAVKRHRDRQS